MFLPPNMRLVSHLFTPSQPFDEGFDVLCSQMTKGGSVVRRIPHGLSCPQLINTGS